MTFYRYNTIHTVSTTYCIHIPTYMWVCGYSMYWISIIRMTFYRYNTYTSLNISLKNIERHTFYRYPRAHVCGYLDIVCGYLQNYVLYLQNCVLQISTYSCMWVCGYSMWISVDIKNIEHHTFYYRYKSISIQNIERHTLYRYPRTHVCGYVDIVCGYLQNYVVQISTYLCMWVCGYSMRISIERMTF